jgi:Uma2 family endonuclease
LKPVLLVIAGPNGAGKTTITARLRSEHWSEGVEYLNPDEVARDRFGDWNSPDAILKAARWRIALEAGTNDVITNPQFVIEVLSSSTEPYDRGPKWEGYQRIPSLSDYVLVSQSEPRIEHFLRERDGAWVYRAAGPGDRLVLGGGTVLDVDTIFAGAFDIAGE